MYRVREFYDDLETFYLFLMFAFASILLIVFMSFAIIKSNLVAEYTTPDRYRDESIVVAEIDWAEAVEALSATIGSD